MTPSPDRQEPERMTIPRLAERVGRSRTLLHRLAANPAEGWPKPTYRPGSTRPEYDVAWFDQYWEEREAGITQGRRTDRPAKKPKQGDPMATTEARPQSVEDVVTATLQSLQGGTHHLAPLTLTVLTEKLTEALTPYLAAQRAAVLREAADAVAQLVADGEHDPDCLVDELRNMASMKEV